MFAALLDWKALTLIAPSQLDESHREITIYIGHPHYTPIIPYMTSAQLSGSPLGLVKYPIFHTGVSN